MRRENSSLYETEKTKQVISISHAEPIIQIGRNLGRSVVYQRTINQFTSNNWPVDLVATDLYSKHTSFKNIHYFKWMQVKCNHMELWVFWTYSHNVFFLIEKIIADKVISCLRLVFFPNNDIITGLSLLQVRFCHRTSVV